MYKNAKRMMALGLTMVLSLTAATGVALADDPVAGQYDDGTAPLTKQVRAPQSLSIPANSYTFEIVPGTVNGTSEAAPDINNDTSDPADDNKIVVAIAAQAASGLTDGSDGYYYYEAPAVNILANTTFPHGGVYTYTIKEEAGTTALGNGVMAYSQAEYTMDVYVANPGTPENGTSDLKVTYVQFTKTKNDDGTTPDTPVKAPLTFINTYNKAVPFQITKTTAGNYANLDQEFTYNLTITAAPGITSETYYGVITDSTSTVLGIVTASTGTSVDFTLKNGQYLLFENKAGVTFESASYDLTALPIGTTYTLDEIGTADYTASVTVKQANSTLGSASADAGKTVIIGAANSDTTYSTETLKSPVSILDDAVDGNDTDIINSAAWLNTYKTITTPPTGIVMDNLPFIMLILIAVSGFAGYIVLKRKKRY